MQNRVSPERMDDIKLKQRSKNVKIDQQIKELQNLQQNPIRIIVAEKTVESFVYVYSQPKKAKATESAAAPVSSSQVDLTKEEETINKVDEEVKEKTPKKERPMKKEKTPKKEKVQSMNIMSFLKHSKKTETPKSNTTEKEINAIDNVVDETPSKIMNEIDHTDKPSFLEENQGEKPSIESLVELMKKQMKSYHERSVERAKEQKRMKEVIMVSLEEKKDEVMEIEEKDEEKDEETAVVEVENEFETEADIVEVTPHMFTETVPQKHMIMTINKQNLSPLQLLTLPHVLGFRYIHPDTDTSKSKVLFGISHATSDSVTGRCPLGHDDRIDYSHDSDDSEEELNEDDIQGDDCDDTESDASEIEETANQLDYGDGFLAEEDINIGDANMTAEEKSALVFRSVSGNKGKLNQQVKLSNQPFVLSRSEGPLMGVDLKQCKTIICDPVFFASTVASMREKRLEVGVGEEPEQPNVETPRSAKKVNMSEDMVKELKELIVGQSFTISQINDRMQERYPGLPKRQVTVYYCSYAQIENKLHEIAEKKHRIWNLRVETPQIASLGEFKPVEPTKSFPIDLDTLMSTHGSPLPPRELSQHKRIHEDIEMEDNPDEAVITTVSLTDNSRSEKRQRIQPERIPDGSILQGNISHSAFAIDPHDEGPSSFGHLMQNCFFIIVLLDFVAVSFTPFLIIVFYIAFF